MPSEVEVGAGNALATHDLKGRRVLVAGGAGFVGSAIVRELVAQGAQTSVLDNFFHGTPANLWHVAADVRVCNVDARDASATGQAVRSTRPDIIINCIGDTYVPSAYEQAGRFFDINLGCQLNLLDAARASDVRRFLYVSSTEVYGSSSPGPISEDAILAPVNTYAVSKAASDRLSHTYHLEHGVPVVVARLFNCYGPRETHPYVIPDIISQLSRSTRVELGNLTARRDFTYVHDAANALIALAASEVPAGEVVNVGSDVSYSVEELVHLVARELGIGAPQIAHDPARLRRCDIDSFRCDNRKLRRLTGWAPRVDIGDGLRRTIEYFHACNQRWSWEERSNDVALEDPPRREVATIARIAQPTSQIPVAQPHLWGDELDELSTVLRSGWVSSRAPVVEEFEDSMAQLLGRRHAIAVSSGTSAVHLALESLHVGDGDEVIVPDFCMIAPVFAVSYCGAVPVPVEVDETWNMDAAAIAEAITPRTRAILVVHNYGHPAAMHRIRAVADQAGLPIVEDAAEAMGARVKGRLAGTFGEVAAFSLYANKLITTGEGGMVVTDDPEIAQRVRWKRDMCFGADDLSRYIHGEVGYSYRLTGLQAAVGLSQLRHAEEALARKRAVAERYRSRLGGLPGIELPPEAAWASNAYWVFGVLVDPSVGTTRDGLQRALATAGIETRRFFRPVHKQPFLSCHVRPDEFPRSVRLSERGLYLPSSVGLTDSEIDRVAQEVHTALHPRYHISAT